MGRRACAELEAKLGTIRASGAATEPAVLAWANVAQAAERQ
jgi:hypothetical protein